MIIDHIDVPEAQFDAFVAQYPRPLTQRTEGSVTHYYDDQLDPTPNHIAVAYHGLRPDGSRGKFWIARPGTDLTPKNDEGTPT